MKGPGISLRSIVLTSKGGIISGFFTALREAEGTVMEEFWSGDFPRSINTL